MKVCWTRRRDKPAGDFLLLRTFFSGVERGRRWRLIDQQAPGVRGPICLWKSNLLIWGARPTFVYFRRPVMLLCIRWELARLKLAQQCS